MYKLLLVILLVLACNEGMLLRFHCIRGCRCNRHQLLVVCSRGTFTRLPRFSYLTRTLNLNDNSLLNLTLHRFSNKSNDLWELSELSVKRNNLTTDGLTLNNLEFFPKLRILLLDGNNITQLPNDLFRNNPLLEKLSLSNNPLVISDPSSLQALNHPSIFYSLKYLDLSGTYLNNGSLPSFFSNLSSLAALLLQATTIQRLDTNFTSVLTSISNFRRIDLSLSTILEADESAFSGFEKLSEVDFSRAKMKLDVFQAVIHSLNSTSVEVLNLDRIFVSEDHNHYIPHSLFHRYNASRLNVLNLDGNFMAFRNGKLPERLLHPLRHLTDLYLDHCNLLSIPLKTFHNLNFLRKLSLKGNLISCSQGSNCEFLIGSPVKRLKYLDLSNNRLCNLKGAIHFSDKVFPSLEFLDLKYNNLVSIDVSIFKSLTRLIQLDLSHNAILENIAPNSFQHLSYLSTLNLEGSKHLSRLKQGSFNGLISLRVLNLRDSSLIHIHHSAFNHLYQLEELYLRRNRFGEFKNSLANVTMHKSSLKTVDLGENELTSLPIKLFSNSYDLHTLYLDGNKFFECDQLNLISSSTVLETLDLSNNLLVSPKKECFANLVNLKSLDLSGTPFLCNCPLFDFSLWLLSSGLTDHSHQGYVCAAPPSLARKNIFSYNPSNFDCPEFREAFLLVCLSLCVATLAFFAGAFCSMYLNRKTTLHRSSISNPAKNSSSGRYSPLYEENSTRGCNVENVSCDSNESLTPEDYFNNDHQRQNLVDPTTWKLSGIQKVNKNGKIFSKNKNSYLNFSKQTKKNKNRPSSNGNEASLTKGQDKVEDTRESELNVIDGRDLALRVTPADSFDCQIHVEDSVL